MDVAVTVRTLRNERGWSQDALARRAEKPRQTIQNLESGRTKSPDLETLRAIARGLEMEVSELIRLIECAPGGIRTPKPDGYQSWAFAA